MGICAILGVIFAHNSCFLPWYSQNNRNSSVLCKLCGLTRIVVLTPPFSPQKKHFHASSISLLDLYHRTFEQGKIIAIYHGNFCVVFFPSYLFGRIFLPSSWVCVFFEIYHMLNLCIILSPHPLSQSLYIKIMNIWKSSFNINWCPLFLNAPFWLYNFAFFI